MRYIIRIAFFILLFTNTLIAQVEIQCPDYFNSNTDWWLSQFDSYPDYTNHNCGPACTAMIINYLKNKGITTTYQEVISEDYPDVHCYARWNYCQGNGHPNGYANSDWSTPGADTNQIKYVLTLEGIEYHTLSGYDCYNDGTGIQNIQDAIDQGKACICLVAPMYYRGDVTEYFSHWTTVYGYDNDYIYLNDPGYITGQGFKADKNDFGNAIWEVTEISKIFIIDTKIKAPLELCEITRGEKLMYPSLVQTSDGILHCAYVEGLKVWYAKSTDNGINWFNINVPTPTVYYHGYAGILHCQLVK